MAKLITALVSVDSTIDNFYFSWRRKKEVRGRRERIRRDNDDFCFVLFETLIILWLAWQKKYKELKELVRFFDQFQ